MAVPVEAKREALRRLMAALPDEALDRLDGAAGDAEAVADLVGAERLERRAAAAIFAPIAPACRVRDDGGWSLPPDTPRRLWRALAEHHPDEARRALDVVARQDLEAPDPALLDEMCGLAAELAANGDAGPEIGANGDTLATALRLSSLVRRAAGELSGWMGRVGDERAAAARLAYRDAASRGPEAGPLFLDLMAAHLPEAWRILGVVSSVMGRPSDRFAAASELAPFGERVLAEVERRVAAVRGLDAEAGAGAGAEGARAVREATARLDLFETAFELSRDGPWGRRVHALRRELAETVEGRLAATERAVADALPLQAQRSKAVRASPRLEGSPDPGAAGRAQALIGFVAELRGAADGGYGSARARTTERLADRLQQYVEDLLERIRAREADEAAARAHLDVAAELYGRLTDARAGEAARRRAAAA